VNSKDPLDLDEPLDDGLGALFMTEEGLRRTAAQLPVPKEALAALLAQAERTKDEVTRVLAEELRRFLRSEGLKRELAQIFSGMSLEVKARVRLVPDDKSARPHRTQVKVTPSPGAARSRKRKTPE